MPHPLLIVSQSDYLIHVDDTNSHTEWQTVHIQIIGFSLIWTYTVCKGRAYPGSAGPGLKNLMIILWEVFSLLHKYHIRPNYCTVRLGFSNLQDTLICGQIRIYLLRIHYKKDQKRTYLMMTMRFFLTFFTKAYVVGTHLNCIDLSMQFKWVPQHMLL